MTDQHGRAVIASGHGPAGNGADAIAAARRVRPDIVLMDLSMPGMDGWEATRQIKADSRTKNIVVIAVTAHAFPREQDAARHAGCDAVIAKPFDLVVLSNALRRVVLHGIAGFDAERITAKSKSNVQSA